MDILKINIPEGLIAQHPAHQRDACKLLVLNKGDGSLETKMFRDIKSFFKKGDVLVLNNSKVVNSRFMVHKSTGGAAELFILRPKSGTLDVWHGLIKGKNIKSGSVLTIDGSDIEVRVLSKNDDGTFEVEFPKGINVFDVMASFGKLPLPPYVKREPDTEDKEYYQTVFAKEPGSVASPTAALHFTPALLEEIKELGVEIVFVTLHVGYGTFSIVRDIEHHVMHEEAYSVDKELETILKDCRNKGSNIWAVGTTVVRTLESAFNEKLDLVAPYGATKLFIRPGYKFKVVDSLVTNFHHPSTTLIHLVAAFAGEDNICRSYQEAVSKGYRMLSYGDAMAII